MEAKDGWYDPYPLKSWIDQKNKREHEDQVYATQVINGKGYRIAEVPDGPGQKLLRTYCIGPVEVIGDKVVPKKQVTDIPLTSISHAQDINEKAVTLSNPTNDTTEEIIETVNVTKQPRKMRVALPEEEILKSSETTRQLADRFNVSPMTISRIRRGQRVLV